MLATALKRCSPLVFLIFTGSSAVAQHVRDSPGTCAACGGVLGFFIALFVINIAILVWVARDAKARGMDAPILWMLLVFFFSLVGLLIYFFARTKGTLVPCPNCKNKRLSTSLVCPHCGFGR